jgi:hypothetical protein
MVTPFQKNYTLDEMNIENMKPVANFLKGGRKSSTSTVPCFKPFIYLFIYFYIYRYASNLFISKATVPND